jgi:hypothetical protein
LPLRLPQREPLVEDQGAPSGATSAPTTCNTC